MAVSEAAKNPRIDVESSIKALLYFYPYLHEYRLQMLVYMSDLVAIHRGLGKLTEATFRPYMHGSYSDEVRETLHEIENQLEMELDYHHGKATMKYKYDSEPDLADEETELIEDIFRSTENCSNNDLKKWCKNTYLYESTPYGAAMDFEDYEDKVNNDNKRVRKDISKEFPELL